MESKEWYNKLIAWREKHIAQKNFILILSFFVGILAALAAFVLKSSIHIIQYQLTSRFNPNEVNYWYLVFTFDRYFTYISFC